MVLSKGAANDRATDLRDEAFANDLDFIGDA